MKEKSISPEKLLENLKTGAHDPCLIDYDASLYSDVYSLLNCLSNGKNLDAAITSISLESLESLIQNYDVISGELLGHVNFFTELHKTKSVNGVFML